jgi:hypothetical protein
MRWSGRVRCGDPRPAARIRDGGRGRQLFRRGAQAEACAIGRQHLDGESGESAGRTDLEPLDQGRETHRAGPGSARRGLACSPRSMGCGASRPEWRRGSRRTCHSAWTRSFRGELSSTSAPALRNLSRPSTFGSIRRCSRPYRNGCCGEASLGVVSPAGLLRGLELQSLSPIQMVPVVANDQGALCWRSSSGELTASVSLPDCPSSGCDTDRSAQ